MSSSTTPRSEPTARSSLAMPRRWTSASRFRPSSMLPRRGEGEGTPFLLCAALLVAAGAQLAAPIRTELPDPSPPAPRRAREPPPPLIPAYPATLRTPIFPPDRTPGEAASATDAGTAPSLQLLGAATTAHGASV